jgi:hypothetical protein
VELSDAVKLFVRSGLAMAVLLLILCGPTSAKSAAPGATKHLHSFMLGFSQGADVSLASGNPHTQAFWVPRAHHEDTQIVRLDVYWDVVAPGHRTAGFDAQDPLAPGYNWAEVDEAVRELSAAHFKILLTVQAAPSWAEGPNMPKTAAAGTWEPKAGDLAAFATAIARRYDGNYPDPLDPGRDLPPVRYWQGWDEPNLPEFLEPQWTHSPSRGYQAASPDHYRSMANAFYSAVKRVSGSNYVVLAGLAPYGDPPGGLNSRMRPVQFERDLLCVTPRLKRASRCGGPTYFDAIDAHPYAILGPNWSPSSPDDLAIPDFYKLVQVLHAADRFGTPMPHAAKGRWVTEVSWDTDPPDPQGVPAKKVALWLEQALHILWKQGVDTVLWWQLADAPPVPNYASTYQAGVYYLDGRAKESAIAFLFPVVAWHAKRNALIVWGRSPEAGLVAIRVKAASGWRTLVRVRVAKNQVFQVSLHPTSGTTLRAQIDGYTSLPWPLEG